MRNKQYYVYNKPYVFVVLEHSFGTQDCKVHGVYTTKQSAEGKKAKLKAKGANGYLAVLKKSVEGARVHTDVYYTYDNTTELVVHN